MVKDLFNLIIPVLSKKMILLAKKKKANHNKNKNINLNFI
jgi:hypothetical protein